MKSSGFPHSDILGSKLTYSSPRHIGVRPVLLRLLAPRHPPCALSSLTTWMWAHQCWSQDVLVHGWSGFDVVTGSDAFNRSSITLDDSLSLASLSRRLLKVLLV
jgi:hypothetical protein